MSRLLFSVLLFLIIWGATTIRANAQITYSYSDISYDDYSNTITGYAATEVDYWSAYYYRAEVDSYLYDSSTGQLMDSGYGSDPEIAEVYISTSATAGDTYTIDSYHDVIADYHYSYVQKSPEGCYPCDGCNDDCYYYYETWYWYDPFGFSFRTTGTGNNGPWSEVYGEGPSVYVEEQEYIPLAETSASVLTPPDSITFSLAKIYQGDQSTFSELAGIPTAVLLATETQCNPSSDFTLTVNYNPPSSTREIYQVVAKGFGNSPVSNWYVHTETINNNYNLNVTPHTGSVSMTVNNKNGGRTSSPYDVIQVTVKGAYNSGESFSGLGKVRIQCP